MSRAGRWVGKRAALNGAWGREMEDRRGKRGEGTAEYAKYAEVFHFPRIPRGLIFFLGEDLGSAKGLTRGRGSVRNRRPSSVLAGSHDGQ